MTWSTTSRSSPSIDIAGRILPAGVDSSGALMPMQPLQGRVKQGQWQPNANSATLSSFGIVAPTVTGTAQQKNVASTSLYTSMRRLGYSSAAGAGNVGGIRLPAQLFWLGNAAGLGGFFLQVTHGCGDAATVAGARQFVGFRGITTAPTDIDPSTQTDIIGMGHDAGQTTMQIMHNDAAGVATMVDLGANFPTQTLSTDVYEMTLYATTNATTVNYRVERLNTGHVATGTISTNLPANTTLLAIQMWRGNGATALAVTPDLFNLYIETER